jgi:hypothetical protein
MKTLEMNGPHPLSDEGIDAVLRRTAPGNYALGYMDGETFSVFYVGRSDTDVRSRLRQWVGMPSRSRGHTSSAKAPWRVRGRGPLPLGSPMLGGVASFDSSYTCFAYSYATSPEAAFEKQCRNYHDLGGPHGLDNETPPASHF